MCWQCVAASKPPRSGWWTALCLVLSAFVGCGIGIAQSNKMHAEEIAAYDRALQLQQLCSTRWSGNYEADFRRHVAVSAMCKEMMSR